MERQKASIRFSVVHIAAPTVAQNKGSGVILGWSVNKKLFPQECNSVHIHGSQPYSQSLFAAAMIMRVMN